MPVFTYKAYNDAGQLKTGISDADTARDARLKLRREGLLVTEISEMETVSDKQQSRFRQNRLRRSTQGELPQVTRQLATLIRSGIPLNDAIKALVEQVENPKLEAVMRNVRERINQGASLAEAIEQHPGVFPPLYLSMVKAGEASGNLDIVLERLAQFMLKQAKVKNKVGAALMYPLIMLGVGAIVVAILMTMVVPKLITLVEAKGKELPTTTEILKGTSEFLGNYWYLLLLGIVLANMILGAIRRTDGGRMATDRLMLKLPIFGELFKKQAISRFSVTLATLLKTGVPILEALKIVRELVNNAAIEEVIDHLHRSIMEGADISGPLKRSGVFPPMVGYMIAIGEQSGELEEVLERIAESYELEVELATERMTSILEPFLILFMAMIVAFIVVAIVSPMLEMSNLG